MASYAEHRAPTRFRAPPEATLNRGALQGHEVLCNPGTCKKPWFSNPNVTPGLLHRGIVAAAALSPFRDYSRGGYSRNNPRTFDRDLVKGVCRVLLLAAQVARESCQGQASTQVGCRSSEKVQQQQFQVVRMVGQRVRRVGSVPGSLHGTRNQCCLRSGIFLLLKRPGRPWANLLHCSRQWRSSRLAAGGLGV